MNPLRKILFVFPIFAFLGFGLSEAFSQSRKPNIIYIMTDDMGYGDLGCYGQTKFQTPNLDKLASEGIKFLNAYAAAPLCTPTRTALMTGRYPARTPVGLLEPLTPAKRDSAFGLTTEYPSVATLMREAGYETALVGKWHLGFMTKHSPNKNGFDYFFGIHSGAADYISHKSDGRKHDVHENEELVYPEGYLTDIFSDRAASFIKQKHSKPFYLTVTYTAPHWPWQGPGDKPYPDSVGYVAGGSPEIYARMMKSLDEGIGRIMQALEESKLAAETIVIFTNDNGGERFSSHGPLSKSKGSLWEGGIKVPAFVRWPGKIKPGTETTQVVTTMDWTATILAAGKGKPHKAFPLDGIDIMPILTQKSQPVDRTLFWRVTQRAQQKAARIGDWKYLKDQNGEYLFHIAKDEGEKNNLKDQNPEIFNRLKAALEKWESTMLVPIPL